MRIYDFVVPEKDVYTLQYPRASGTSDLISSSIFGIQRQIRHEALTYHYPDSKVIVQPRPGFVLSYIPRCLNDLPFDVLKVAKEIEANVELLPPFSWSGGPDGDLLRVSFTVSAEGIYTTGAHYRSKRENRARKILYRTQTAELRMYVEEQTAKLENLMLTQLEGRELKEAANSPEICIEVDKAREKGRDWSW
ncbi:hypothetical protein HII31_06497 [Pseudocercospora fuligena]|uniref:Uncharacterized protein n=1 Tax=Pseudocercospora fuligena TaxID=685502 RepID=A0A8H6RL85_9PEZI|nr:hypothetical protein HII31_06497 [Pseudocercospora fuligena]